MCGWLQFHMDEKSRPFEKCESLYIGVVLSKGSHTAFLNYGSVLWFLIHVVMVHLGTPEDNLKLVWNDINRLYKEMGVVNKYWIIRMTMFSTGSQPKMKGKARNQGFDTGACRSLEKYYNPELGIQKDILTV